MLPTTIFTGVQFPSSMLSFSATPCRVRAEKSRKMLECLRPCCALKLSAFARPCQAAYAAVIQISVPVHTVCDGDGLRKL